MSIFAGKTLMITGGTGSFGNAVLNRFLRTDIGEIRIFSRDEKKQDDMRTQNQIFYRRCAQSSVMQKRHARRGLYLPCRSSEAGAFVRVLPHGSRENQRDRYG